VHSLTGDLVLADEHDQVKCSPGRAWPLWTLLYRKVPAE
jgi:hypothetical protein